MTSLCFFVLLKIARFASRPTQDTLAIFEHIRSLYYAKILVQTPDCVQTALSDHSFPSFHRYEHQDDISDKTQQVQAAKDCHFANQNRRFSLWRQGFIYQNDINKVQEDYLAAERGCSFRILHCLYIWLFFCVFQLSPIYVLRMDLPPLIIRKVLYAVCAFYRLRILYTVE